MIVLDTNIVLDVFVFNDPATQPLRQALDTPGILWIATQPMRDELERVLVYPKIVARLVSRGINAEQVLGQFDTCVTLLAVAGKASVTCTDADDQKFIDLAVAHKARLFSKDRAVTCMKKRLLNLGVIAQSAI
jgi:putative PIN family toxin of toxin-antitoxin system